MCVFLFCCYKQYCREHAYLCLLAHMGQWDFHPSWAVAHLLGEQSRRTQEALVLLALLLERDLVVRDIYSRVEECEHWPAEGLLIPDEHN